MASLSNSGWRDVCDKFKNAQTLSCEESLKDPVNDPYRSKYKARELIREIHCTLKSLEAGEGEEESGGDGREQRASEAFVDGQRDELFTDGLCGESPPGMLTAKLAAVEFYLGVNHAETEELSAGHEHLMNCVMLLERCRVSSENVSLSIHVRNELGIMWTRRDEAEKALQFLETAEFIYQRYMKEDGSPPMDKIEYFTTEEKLLTDQERTEKFEFIYTYTKYYLAQVYKIVGETERAATYCHNTLQRLLPLKQFNRMEWALNAATLSQYYISKGQFMEGRHCLSAASVILGLAEVPSEAAAQESEAASEQREKNRMQSAHISRCWIKYCLNLLEDAKKLLEDNTGELDTDRQDELKRERTLGEEEEVKSRKSALLFGSEDTFDSIASLEEKVPCLFPLDFSEARAVFLVGQNHVKEAKEYFQMEGHVTDHVEILQDHSALFRTLAFFEEDLEARCKMHKRRIDMMEPVCNELNAQYYLMIRRQLMFELAEIYNEMMDLKMIRANTQADTQSLDKHSIKKINHLCSSAVKYFHMFLDSLRSPDGKFPEKMEEDVLRPALVARFRMARLYSKLICSLPSAQLENLNKALDNYTCITQYCEEHPEAAAAVETELELSKEMVELLPFKINRLKVAMVANN
ncbi:KIF-binding protein [Takifugu rubripes]|uniref:KIF-binding protein n=1 Tax=Takifugu rubripes TaxID=31033 RepID=H2RTB8_TAKRU|nr:KIF1-binding protein [Takifugu rubripes]|eukprot:XP_003969525.1 PREDICTED: KIF1-binding protein [Takifugu rubripes]